MDGGDDRQKYSREPTIDDLVELCRHLNGTGARYVVIGGFAIILNGYIRTTGDIDLLVDSSAENIARIKKALLYLPDQAIHEIETNEVAKYAIVRIADEIIVDLMQKACDVTYKDTLDHIKYHTVNDVRIPFLEPNLLLRTKMSMRAKDADDRFFLKQLLEDRTTDLQQFTLSKESAFLPFFSRLIRKTANFLRRRRN